MLRFLKPYETHDFSRDLQLNYGYGIQICPNNRSVQWTGAYSETEGTIGYFYARFVNNAGQVEKTYILNENCITYSNYQYNYDPDSVYGTGILPEGYYYLEFNDGLNTFYSELFCVKCVNKLFIASGDWLASGGFLVSQLIIDCDSSSPELENFILENGEYFVLD